jgi:photosystem II stability/assembly factor-like uncharacterized protein
VPVLSGTTADLHAVHFGTADVGFAVGTGGTALRSIDGGLSWNNASPAAAPDLHDVHFFDLESGVAVGDGGAIYRTVNAGVDWTLVPSGVSVPLQSVSFSGDVGIAGGGSQTILRSVNRGETWTIVQTDFFGGGFPGAHMLDATNGFVAGTNSIFQPLFGASDDAGATFDFIAFYLNSNEGNLRDVHFLSPKMGVVAGVTWDGQGALARTVNGGADWTVTLFPSTNVHALDFATATLGYAVGEFGWMLRTADAGATWQPTPPSMSVGLLDIHFPTATTGIAVGPGGTILRGTLTTASAPVPAAPAALLAVRPNPMADRSAVLFELSTAGHATVRVFDAMGRQVAVLADGPHAAGAHAASLDAGGLPAGAYLVVLETPAGRLSRVALVGR